MISQPSLFEVPRPYPAHVPEPSRDGRHPGFHTVDPISSREAAHRASGNKANHLALVLAALVTHDGATGAELAVYLPFDVYETRRRLSDLLHEGKARQGDVRMCGVAATRAVTWWAWRQ